ncbi:hypothetical protein KZ829_06215 [Actinoplanes hulinensis]|uniref:LamG-like jellyroll fold domain-containing protein n=1 Tax=Actinoplanes hulinensis TaxID=1144547 RepID=A0ABS7AX81_9ACTN|nr:LamG-like jellyroll fold domain-containing protein [Actinoplanes hulinensis]MBW6433338.1 hypothetical protein [Actinoplanes hulinensis]
MSTFIISFLAPEAAQAAACPAAVVADTAPVAQTELAAQKLAQLCGKPVEVNEAASETTKAVALPSGEFTFESYLEPQRVKRDSRWIDLDTRLQQGADGKFRPAAAADVTFSAGGTGPFVVYRQGDADFTLSWPAPLPAGVVSGDSVTYPEVYPGTDLVVRSVAGGFSHVLVVKTPAAAANPAVREASYQVGGSATLSEVDGELRLSGPKGVVAQAPRASAWDSNRTDHRVATTLRSGVQAAAPPVSADPSTVRAPGGQARQVEVDVSVADGQMQVKADEALFASGATYPIYIDPTFQPVYQKWIPVSKLKPDTKWVSGDSYPREVMRVGSNWDNTSDVWRAHMQFDIRTLHGKRITSKPSVEGVLTHTGWCAGEPLSLWHTNAIDGNTPTWDGMSGKWLHGAALQTKTVKSNANCDQGTTGFRFDATAVQTRVLEHVNKPYNTITFGLRVPSESGGHWVKIKRGTIKLIVAYAFKPTSPEAIRSNPGGSCNKTSPGPWINNSKPTLYGRATDGDGKVRVVFDLTGPTTPADYKSPWVNSKSEASFPITTALADGSYKWRVQGTDDVVADNTAWTAYCYFRQDHTPPTLPVIARTSTGAPELGKPITLSFTSTDALSGIAGFDFGIGVDAKQSSLASTGTVSHTFTPDSGRTQIYVWARDNAGNASTRAIYNIFTGRVTPIVPMALWRLTHDLRDDSGTTDVDGTLAEDADQKDLQWLGTDALTYTADRAGRGGAALSLAGNGCAYSVPVVRSDGAFTAGAWVKMTNKTAHRTIMVMTGTNQPSFVLSYNVSLDRWATGLTTGDVAGAGMVVASGNTSPAVNTWTHVAATVDPVGKVLSLYVNGTLEKTAAITTTWSATGRTLIGCGGTNTTVNGTSMVGAIDQVGVWSGLLSKDQIAASAAELPAGIVAKWAMRSNGDDASEHGYDLTVPAPPVTEPTPEPTPEPTEEPTGEPTPDPTDTGTPGDPDPEPTGDPEVPDESAEPTEEPTTEPTTPPVPSEPAPEWVGDQYSRPNGAWNVTGDRCATSSRSVVRSDESFTLAVWAKVDDTSKLNQTIIGADGNRVSGWFLGARANAQGVPFWALMMKATDDETSASEWAGSTTDAFAATVGKWTHLVGVYNATTKTISLFVNGTKVSSVTRTGGNWVAGGPLTVGCGRYAAVPADYFRGGITDVRVWRGALTDVEATALRGSNPPVTLRGMWPLEGPESSGEPTELEDRSGNGRHLTVAGAYTWERDRANSREGALGLSLDEGSCAQTAGSVVPTDGSFSVTAWVVLDEATGTRTVVAQSGANRQGFRLEYSGTANRWRFVMPQGDTTGAADIAIASTAAPELGVWTHLAAVYDLPAKKFRFYVNGDEQGDGATAPTAPWNAAGPLTVGCAATTGGQRSNYLGGIVDDVRVWTSTVDPELFGTFAHA